MMQHHQELINLHSEILNVVDLYSMLLVDYANRRKKKRKTHKKKQVN